ncbi:hypothetical protein FJR48_12095 (plasmid) [Sulfurimonas lithotrophica]|uniref:Fimbrial assembly family protein n=1 Tax=Sulfurimonas lithotrophica TaxID=2590022 RepID=A0A5P8P2L0_9BACT|nr:hypothetical protein [Sulfurimonas lithotrophica]QFR49958.1 hypothetical protein FJR48_09565 [Sulfurimonas lithotrophica]QFR50535.1 hypothetical protein FJR48_12095 [Sulfurimonas lithotrophica]
MRYSYIKPRKKSLLTAEMKLLFAFFSISLFMLLGTYIFLLYKDMKFLEDKQNIAMEKTNLQKNIKDMESKIAYIEQQNITSAKIFTQNSVLKDSIKNLFDLVPQRITLSQAKLLKNGLVLYGITPNKDVYNFMLHAPLRSIFHETYSSFYPTEGGWLRFVSTNYMNEDELSESSVESDSEKKDE